MVPCADRPLPRAEMRCAMVTFSERRAVSRARYPRSLRGHHHCRSCIAKAADSRRRPPSRKAKGLDPTGGLSPRRPMPLLIMPLRAAPSPIRSSIAEVDSCTSCLSQRPVKKPCHCASGSLRWRPVKPLTLAIQRLTAWCVATPRLRRSPSRRPAQRAYFFAEQLNIHCTPNLSVSDPK